MDLYSTNGAYVALSKIFCMITVLLKKYYGWHISISRKDANSITARKTLTQFQEKKASFWNIIWSKKFQFIENVMKSALLLLS